MNSCSSCEVDVPRDASFCPCCGTRLGAVCSSCGEREGGGPESCTRCRTSRSKVVGSTVVVEEARTAFAAGSLEQLDSICSQLQAGNPHASRIRAMRSDLACRQLFERREALRLEFTRALEANDRSTLARLRQESESEPDLAQLCDELAEAAAERRESFESGLQDLVSALREGDVSGFLERLPELRQLAASRAVWQERLEPFEKRASQISHEGLDLHWYIFIIALACLPFPVGLWLVAVVANGQARRFSRNAPRKAASLTRLSLFAAPIIALNQILAVLYFLLQG